MSEQNKPKFKLGDTVILTLNGNVGKITDIQYIGGQYVYKINKSKGYFLESSIQLYPQVNEDNLDKEQIDINYQFYIGDIVKVSGYQDLFKVVGFRTEIWRYKNDAWEDVIYELARLSNGDWLEASEHELTFIIDEKQAEALIKKKGIIDMNNIFGQKVLQLTGGSIVGGKNKHHYLDEQKVIDDLLDQYNDYRTLYKMFADQKYQEKMKKVLHKLEVITEKEGHQ